MHLTPGNVQSLLAFERKLCSFRWDTSCEFLNLGLTAKENEQLVMFDLKLLSAYAAISIMRT